MKIELYSEKEVSKIDKARCIQGFRSHEFGSYTILNGMYVVYKGIPLSTVLIITNSAAEWI